VVLAICMGLSPEILSLSTVRRAFRRCGVVSRKPRPVRLSGQSLVHGSHGAWRARRGGKEGGRDSAYESKSTIYGVQVQAQHQA
jgi:hypothetical protein